MYDNIIQISIHVYEYSMRTTPKICPYVLEEELLILGRKSFIELYMVKSIKNFRCSLGMDESSMLMIRIMNADM